MMNGSKISRFLAASTAALALVASSAACAADELCRGFEMQEVSHPTLPGADETSYLWKIKASSGAESYLFGSFHSDNSQVLNNWETLTVLISKMKTFIGEMSFSPDAGREFGRATLGEPGALEKRLGTDFYGKLGDLLAPYHIDKSYTERFKPWAAFLQLGKPTGPQHSLDALLSGQAEAADVDTVGLQTVPEMVAAMESLSLDDQLRILKESICSYSDVQIQIRNMMKLYSQDDVGTFLRETERLTSPMEGLNARLVDALVTQRNRIFVPRLQPYLEKGDAFVIVGAAHLFGEQGLLKLLRNAGYSVTPLERQSFTNALFSSAAPVIAPLPGELLQWLKGRDFAIPADYQPPRADFAHTADLERMACGGPCKVTYFMDKSHALHFSVELYPQLAAGHPRWTSVILAVLIRDIQLSRNKDQRPSCGDWQQLDTENMILQSQYMASKGKPGVPPERLPPPKCVP